MLLVHVAKNKASQSVPVAVHPVSLLLSTFKGWMQLDLSQQQQLVVLEQSEAKAMLCCDQTPAHAACACGSEKECRIVTCLFVCGSDCTRSETISARLCYGLCSPGRSLQ